MPKLLIPKPKLKPNKKVTSLIIIERLEQKYKNLGLELPEDIAQEKRELELEELEKEKRIAKQTLAHRPKKFEIKDVLDPNPKTDVSTSKQLIQAVSRNITATEQATIDVFSRAEMAVVLQKELYLRDQILDAFIGNVNDPADRDKVKNFVTALIGSKPALAVSLLKTLITSIYKDKGSSPVAERDIAPIIIGINVNGAESSQQILDILPNREG